MIKPLRAKICYSPKELDDRLLLDGNRGRYKTVISGGFAPLHVGHLDYIQEAAKIKAEYNPILIAIVNGDEWLVRKKGFSFMPDHSRASIVASISGVDYVLVWDDGTPTVSGALKSIKPDYFAKGGDRNSFDNVPESAVCKEIGCEVVFDVGGGKVTSSTDLIDNAVKNIGELK